MRLLFVDAFEAEELVPSVECYTAVIDSQSQSCRNLAVSGKLGDFLKQLLGDLIGQQMSL